MERYLTRDDIKSHIKEMAGKNCLYTVIQKRINNSKSEKREEFFKALEEKKFKSYTELDIYLEN